AEAGSDVSRAVTDLLRGGATRTELRRLGQPAVAEVTAAFLGGAPTQPPRRVRDSMQHRLGRMSPAARKAAAVASSLGRRFTVTELAAVLDTPASAVLDPVRELISSELLSEGPQTLSFSH